MVVAWDIAPIGVIDKTRFVEYDVAQVVFDNTKYVCDRSTHISQFKFGKYDNHKEYVDFLTDLIKSVWDKRKVMHA